MEFLKERILLWFGQILIFVKFNRRSETNMIHFEWFYIHLKHICSFIVSTLIYELPSKSSASAKMTRPCRCKMWTAQNENERSKENLKKRLFFIHACRDKHVTLKSKTYQVPLWYQYYVGQILFLFLYQQQSKWVGLYPEPIFQLISLLFESYVHWEE